MEITVYDKTKEYETEIAPLIESLKAKCVTLDIPMLVTAAVANNEKGTVYMTDGVTDNGIGVTLADNRMAMMLLALQGGKFELSNDDRLKGCEEINRLFEDAGEYGEDSEPVPEPDAENVQTGNNDGNTEDTPKKGRKRNIYKLTDDNFIHIE